MLMYVCMNGVQWSKGVGLVKAAEVDEWGDVVGEAEEGAGSVMDRLLMQRTMKEGVDVDVAVEWKKGMAEYEEGDASVGESTENTALEEKPEHATLPPPAPPSRFPECRLEKRTGLWRAARSRRADGARATG